MLFRYCRRGLRGGLKNDTKSTIFWGNFKKRSSNNRLFAIIFLSLSPLSQDGTVVGEVQEWLNWPAWKASKPPKGFRGSNPLLSATKKSLSSWNSGFSVLPPDRAGPGQAVGTKARAARLIPRVLRLREPARRLAQRKSRPMRRPKKMLRRNSFRRSVFSDCAMAPALPAASLGGMRRPPVSVP